MHLGHLRRQQDHGPHARLAVYPISRGNPLARAAGRGIGPSGIPVLLFDGARLGGPHLHALHCFMLWNKVRFANRSGSEFREPLRAMPQPTSLHFHCCSDSYDILL